MNNPNFSNKHIAVIGLGVEGLSSAKFLQDQGAQVTILDQKEERELDSLFLSQAKKHFTLQLGEGYLDNLSSFDLIVRSPGINPNLLELQNVQEKGRTVTSQTQLFLELCKAKVIGVTGTKGKGTTSSLIYGMLKKAGKDVYIGGNIGVPPLTFLEKLTKDSWVVLELSSFQLMDLTISPHIAVMLMVTSEHLDYHADNYEYIDAKRNLVRFQTPEDFAIVNRDYPASNESDIHSEGHVFYISRERETEPGCYVKEEGIWVRQDKTIEKIMNTKDVLLPGKHNLENACAAVMSAFLAGVTKDDIVTVLKTFKGLEHRLELVREVRGVKYYDDSFSTTPETAIAAIEAFSAPEIVILGGSSKNSDFTELAKTIEKAKQVRVIIGIGEEWPVIKQQLANIDPSVLLIEGATTMQQVVLAAAKIAAPGDVVLLSPACASFGMFKNYKDRGDQFKQAVKALSASNY